MFVSALLPAGPDYAAATAGPTFGVGRSVPLPLTPALARTIVGERLAELQQRAVKAAARDEAPLQLRNAATSLGRLELDAGASQTTRR